MKHYAYYVDSGEITVCCTLQDGVDPTGLNGPLHLETETEVSGRTHWVNAGVLVAYADEVAAAKQNRPGYPAQWLPREGLWQDLRTLSDLIAAKWQSIKTLREAAAVAPLMSTRFGVFDAAPKGMANIKDTLAGLIAAEALGMPVSPVRWTMADENTERYVTLTLDELREVGVLLLARGNESHERSRALYDQIQAATTAAEVDAIAWASE